MRHCSDEELLSYQDAELTVADSKVVRKHLGVCWLCRNRLASLEAQANKLAAAAATSLFPGPDWRANAYSRFRTRVKQWELEQSSRAPAQASATTPAHGFPFSSFTASYEAKRFGLIFTIVTSATVGLTLFFLPGKMEAKTILLQSVANEQRTLSQARARHKTWTLQQRKDGRILAHRQVEQWQGRNARPAVQRVYNEQHDLVEGNWISESGERTHYRKGENSRPNPLRTGARPAPRTLDEAALVDLSAEDFLNFVQSDNNLDVHQTQSRLIVEFSAAGVMPDSAEPRLLRASLVLTGTELRATEGILVVGSSSSQSEFHFAETSIETFIDNPPPNVLTAEWEPLMQISLRSIAPPIQAQILSNAPKTSASVEEVTNAPLEVRVIHQLELVNITLGDRAQLERKPNGTLALHLTVDSKDQATKLSRELRPFLGDNKVKVDFSVAQTDLAGSATAAPPRTLPPELRAWATANATAQGTISATNDPEILAQAELNAILANGQRMRAHARAFRVVAERFKDADLATLDAEARNQWRTASIRHLQAMESEAILLHKRLARIFYADEAPEPAAMPTAVLESVRASVGDLEADVETSCRLLYTVMTTADSQAQPPLTDRRKLFLLLRLTEQRAGTLHSAFQTR